MEQVLGTFDHVLDVGAVGGYVQRILRWAARIHDSEMERGK